MRREPSVRLCLALEAWLLPTAESPLVRQSVSVISIHSPSITQQVSDRSRAQAPRKGLKTTTPNQTPVSR